MSGELRQKCGGKNYCEPEGNTVNKQGEMFQGLGDSYNNQG